MSDIAALFGREAWQVVVIARIQPPPLRLLRGGHGPNDDERVRAGVNASSVPSPSTSLMAHDLQPWRGVYAQRAGG
jgi:hypothetical protein